MIVRLRYQVKRAFYQSLSQRASSKRRSTWMTDRRRRRSGVFGLTFPVQCVMERTVTKANRQVSRRVERYSLTSRSIVLLLTLTDGRNRFSVCFVARITCPILFHARGQRKATACTRGKNRTLSFQSIQHRRSPTRWHLR